MGAKEYTTTVSDQQVTTATAVSTNSIDLKAAHDIGEGSPIYANFSCDVSVTRAAGAATITFAVISADNADLTSNVTILNQSDAISKAVLLAADTKVGLAPGYRLSLPVPPLIASKGQRYLGVKYTVSASCDAGKFTCYFGPAVSDSTKPVTAGW